MTWEPERDASDLQSVVSWWGSVLGTLGYGAGQEVSVLSNTPSLSPVT